MRYTSAEIADIAKEMRMNLKDWEATIKQIVDEFNQEPTKSCKDKFLIAWRFGALRERMAKQGFPPDDTLFCQVDRAYDALFSLHYSYQRIEQGSGWFLGDA